MDACVDTGGILGTNSGIVTRDTGIYLVQSYNIISEESWYEGIKNKILGAIFLSFFWSGLRGSKAYSLWGGVIPSPRIGYDYL